MSPLARNRRFSSLSASMSQAQAAVFRSTAQGLTRNSGTPHNRSRHPHTRPPDRRHSPGAQGAAIRHTAEPASNGPCPRLSREPSGEPSASPIEPRRALLSVPNMELDCSPAMQSHAGPLHKPRSHRGSALLSTPPPRAKVPFQRCAPVCLCVGHKTLVWSRTERRHCFSENGICNHFPAGNQRASQSDRVCAITLPYLTCP